MAPDISNRIVDIADRILEFAKRNKHTRKIWYFGTIACELGIPRADVEQACRMLRFTHECHVRDDFFFLKSHEEKMDDLDWTLGAGRFAQ